jgi:hypothetical protein
MPTERLKNIWGVSRPAMTLSGRADSVQLTNQSKRELWPIKLGYPPPTTKHWDSVPQHQRMLTLNSLCCWGEGREATRVHEMYLDSKQGHLAQETLQSAIQTVAYQLVTTTATLVMWELLSLNSAAWHLSNPFQEVCLDRYKQQVEWIEESSAGITEDKSYHRSIFPGQTLKLRIIMDFTGNTIISIP